MNPSECDDPWTAQDEVVLRAAERVRRGLARDPRTGLLGYSEDRYAAAVDVVAAEFGPAQVPLSIVLADLDRFHVFNGNYGRTAGDEALGAVGQTLQELIRPLDMVMTSGGDAFLLILLGADLEVAVSRADLARATIKQLDLPAAPTGVTASFGVATHTGTEAALELLDRALAAEQQAKELGRDRVEVGWAP